jgi:gamma-glutamyl hercynylcysteine S-oxide synthase
LEKILTFKPTPSQPDSVWAAQANITQIRQRLRQALIDSRAATLALFDDVDADTFCQQAHPDFSPVGWHLGHIGYTEGLWLLEQAAGLRPHFPEYQSLFAADGLPKGDRVHLPDLTTITDYLSHIRDQVLLYLEVAPILEQKRLWYWLLQHEAQHSETITLVLELQRHQPFWTRQFSGLPIACSPQSEMVKIEAGGFEQGNQSLLSLDNERPVQQASLPDYWIDRYPVTRQQYRQFMEAGGYSDARWWSAAGWDWLEDNPVSQPLYWHTTVAEDHPVCGVSWYEAEAYARFVGKRLPTEAEWEKAASWHPSQQQRQTYPWGDTEPTGHHCNHNHQVGQSTPVYQYPQGQSAYGCYDLLGNIWEWTDTWFSPYEGFASYPYPGYSASYFDDQHRVLKGGSWATRSVALRSAFRNWYHPGCREIFAGFRCAADRPTPPPNANSQQTDASPRLQLEQLLTAQQEALQLDQQGQDVMVGLSQTPKTLPAKYFYDDRGSDLFEQICALPEYYPTRTEAAILQHYAPAIAQLTGPCELVELGSGSSTKTRLLLDAYASLKAEQRYLPIDVSGGILAASAYELLQDYPDLQIHGLVGTYELGMQHLPPRQLASRMICFLGSTLGNLTPPECDRFFGQIRLALHPGEFFLLGVDLQKAISQLEAAYNDAEGVTAEFNLNMLQHLNWRFGADFNLSQFRHRAIYNLAGQQIEMHLDSLCDQTVTFSKLNYKAAIAAQESILTEISRKFNLATIQQELAKHSLITVQQWTDPQQWFGLVLCQYERPSSS